MRIFLGLGIMGMICVGGCATGNPSTSASASTAVSSFTATDRAWIEITTAMDEQLVPMLNLVDGHTGSAAVRDLGKKVGASTNSELSDLRRLHDQAGLPAENPHKGMEMPGMVSSNQITHAGALREADFDDYFKKCLRDHLDQTGRLALGEKSSGKEPQTVSLASRFLQEQGRLAALVQ
ncbi:DUF305 domain-containing protein [Amycolatopsis sp. WQ 127309]|uniref:DUF305 domain-containing protein n=1 Tax=Amycolatopsis sp. WQ 127309 TaxID=2932773 RepID=UPI001FF14267|nr:DUF305 domain-containing protein [Amycolatopsis sp. WQ 127309]UOZ04922.1 DUF305 domain-containing protein [Amycolatopsis sp. WQ 127309]